MIFIVVKQRVRSEYADDWPEMVRPFTEATRAEPGNISFEWFRSPEDPDLWLLVEAFVNEEAGRVHVESEHFQTVTTLLPEWLVDAPEIVHVETPSEGWDRMSEFKVET